MVMVVRCSQKSSLTQVRFEAIEQNNSCPSRYQQAYMYISLEFQLWYVFGCSTYVTSVQESNDRVTMTYKRFLCDPIGATL